MDMISSFDWKSFVIGSSWLVVVSFFLTIQKKDENIRNYTYKTYTMMAPLYLGLMNVLGGYLFPGQHRYLYTGLLSGLIIVLFSRCYGTYKYDKEEWFSYYGYIMAKHLVTFFVIIQFLTTMVG